MTNLYSLPKEMLIKIITTMQSTSLDLQPYLDFISKNNESTTEEPCTYVFPIGPRQYQKCGNENCQMHIRSNKLTLNNIKYLFEKFPHYFVYVIDIISFVSTYHSNSSCGGCDFCVDDDIYNERMRTFTEELFVTLPMVEENNM